MNAGRTLLEPSLRLDVNIGSDPNDSEDIRLQKLSVEERMYEVLGKPQTCPHGNPLPGYEHVTSQ